MELETWNLDRLREHRGKLLSLGVERIGVFGSVARGDERCDSDVDLLVEFAPGRKSFDAFIHLCFFLEKILERPVEVVTPEGLSPYNRPRVLNEVTYVLLPD